MNRIIIFGILFCLFITGVQAQNKKSTTASKIVNLYSKTASGLEYRIVKDSAGTGFPESEGYMSFWFEMQNNKDSIIDSQFKNREPVGIPTPEVTHKGGIEEGFRLLTAGDSAIFLLNADSLYTNTFRQPRPAYVEAGSTIKMIVKMDAVYSKRFVDSIMALQEQERQVESQPKTPEVDRNEIQTFKKDSIIIQHYLLTHKLKGIATTSGAYVVVLKKSKTSKTFIQSKEEVTTSYIGRLLISGQEFDKSTPGNEFKFSVDSKQVITGWDEAFLKLKKGDKALILIPSRLGYGKRGAGAVIPPDAPLLFEVEVQ
jgi:FKBP-type peptidyl-prolyl cis-trans isomerase FkpA